MSMQFLQRSSLVSSVILAIAAGTAQAFATQTASPEIASAFATLAAAKPKGGTIALALAAIYWFALAASIVGMWRQKLWGLQLGIAVTLASVAQAALLGPHAYTGAAYAIAYASKVLWGVGLGVTAMLVRPSGRGP